MTIVVRLDLYSRLFTSDKTFKGSGKRRYSWGHGGLLRKNITMSPANRDGPIPHQPEFSSPS